MPGSGLPHHGQGPPEGLNASFLKVNCTEAVEVLVMRTLLAWLLFLGSVLPLGGAEIQPAMKAPPGVTAFRSYGADEGLTNLSSQAMVQDAEGFLWVGTEDGLFRLEGNRFRHFGVEDGLPSSKIDINGLSPGLNRGLWVTTSRGLAFWNGQRFVSPSTLGGVNFEARVGVCLAQGGFILSHFGGKARYLSLDGEPFQLLDGLPWGEGLNVGTYDASRERLILVLGRELWVRQGGAWRHRELAKELGAEVLAIWVDGVGRIWFRTPERLARLDTLEGPINLLTLPFRLSMVNGVNLGVDGRGRVWTNTVEGLVWLEGENFGFLGEREGLPQGGAGVLRVDHQGTVWISGEGVHKLLGEGLWTGFTRRQGLPTDVVWTVARTPDDLLWAGTAGGLAAGDEKGWRVLPRTRGNQFLAMAVDGDGNLWTGYIPSRERPGGLGVRVKGSLELQPVPVPGLPPRGFVTALHPEGATLWMGTTSIGLLRATRQGIHLDVQPVKIGNWPREDSINRISPDGLGGLWVAGLRGIAHWNGRTWATLNKAAGLLDDSVLMVAPTSGGTAWISYPEIKGMTRIQRVGDRLVIQEVLLPPLPLVRSPIVAMVSGPGGDLWLGTSRGLLRWNGQRIERFGRHTGFPGEDCAQNGLWFDPNGDIWVGLSVGMVRGRLGLMGSRQAPPPVAMLEASAGNGRSLLEKDGLQRVSWGERTLAFRYGPSGSLGTEDMSYQVRLVGLEDVWRSTTLPEARYPGLGAGTYRFEVRAVNSVYETGKVRAVAFEILPPWWMRPWVLILAGLALMGLTFLAFRWRTTILRRRNEQLEALVKARTQELEVANESLREASLIDPLTGLHNRRFLTVIMPEESVRLHRVFRNLLENGESPLGRNEDLVLFLGDLDHFKRVNDTYGHGAGDRVLVETAQLLRRSSRTSDTLVRWGGEEFLLVAKRSDREKAHLIAEKLCKVLRAHEFVLPDGQRLRCTISVGYAAFPILDHQPEAFTWEDTLLVADQCLYAAKHAGRDGWVGVHTPGPLDTAELGPRLRGDLTNLVREGHIQMRSSFPEGEAFSGREPFGS